MATLTEKERDGLMPNAFAYPKERKYLICSEATAKAALILSARPDTFGTLSHVRSKVKARYPNLATKGD